MSDFRFGVLSFTMAISQSVSDVVHFAAGTEITLFAGALNGATSLGFLVGGDFHDVASGALVTLYNGAAPAAISGGSGGNGSFAARITDLVGGAGAVQIVAPAAQTAARSFKLLVRL